MAFVSQGTTVTWGGTALGELVTVAIDGIQADTFELTPRSRSDKIKSFVSADRDNGTVSVTCRATAVVNITNVGLTAALNIGSPGVLWSFPVAIFQTLGWSASIGELQTYTATFKLGA